MSTANSTVPGFSAEASVDGWCGRYRSGTRNGNTGQRVLPQMRINSGGSSGCLDDCLKLCPRDSIGGIEIACALQCAKICSGRGAQGIPQFARYSGY